MAKLTEKERTSFELIMSSDMAAIHAKMMEQIKNFWGVAREEVMKTKGWDKLTQEKQELYFEMREIQARINEIENEMNSEDLRPEQVAELGGKPNEYGRFKGANFYGIPVTSQFEYDIVDYIRSNIDLEIPVKFIHDLGRACMRELAMSGTFEEAREAYDKFYKLDFRKYGVDIPPRLDEIKDNKERLEQAAQTFTLPAPEDKDPKHQLEFGGEEDKKHEDKDVF